MLIYLDMCCLKRPFDDQSIVRNKLECDAVLAVLAAEGERVQIVRSRALLLENSVNPVKWRAEKVNTWLCQHSISTEADEELRIRAEVLMKMGFKNFDALHVATAEFAGAELLGTCDDKFLSAARRNIADVRVKVVGVLELAAEVMR